MSVQNILVPRWNNCVNNKFLTGIGKTLQLLATKFCKILFFTASTMPMKNIHHSHKRGHLDRVRMPVMEIFWLVATALCSKGKVNRTMA